MEQLVLVATTSTVVILSVISITMTRRLAHFKRELAIHRAMVALHGHCLDNARDLLIVHHLHLEYDEHPDDFIWTPVQVNTDTGKVT
jgi:hypothetical protein